MAIAAPAQADPDTVSRDARLAPQVRVHHALPGRTRLRLEPLRGSRDLLAALGRRLAAREGVLSVRDNAISGSLLVEHQTSLAPETVAETVRALWREGLSAPALPDDSPRKYWHARPAADAIDALSYVNGLTSGEARRRLAAYGENRLPDPSPPRAIELLGAQLKSVPIALLGGSALLSLATGGVLDAVLTLGVIGLNAGIGMSTESWTASLVRRLTATTDIDVPVLRDGAETTTSMSRVCQGDWLVLKPGVRIAADARLIAAEGLTIDESVLTGESVPVEKHADAAVDIDAPLAGRHTMAHRGGVVTSGAGLAVVTATGVAAEYGRVRALLDTTRAPAPPMERALDRLGVRITLACLGASALLSVMLGLRGARPSAIGRSAIALAVSAIPEGLPALAASSKALAARAMSREGVYLRNVNVVEAAANIDVICFDKTGTLTQNSMQAAAAYTPDALWRWDDDAPLPRALHRIALIAALCNDAEIGEDGTSSGSGTERALLRFAERTDISLQRLRKRYPRHAVAPRRADRPFMATEHRSGVNPLIAVKGAPSHVLELCTRARARNGAVAIDDALRAAIAKQNQILASEGLRVLGFAWGAGSLADGEPHDLEWAGLVGLNDPLRHGAGDTIRQLQGAGLRTIILTGDQAPTARKLAQDLGLATDGVLEVLDATELRELPPDRLAAIARKAEVFARVSPTDKLAIIKALQAEGHVVAMTGDGVNDGPALRTADVGVAMGRSGADVARDVADMVIADDDLRSLVSALARGRAADENLRRAVRFLLATNASEVALLLAEALHGPDALETPAQLFWLNLVTDVFPALGLAMSRPAEGILQRAPRRAEHDIFGRAELSSLAGDALRIAAPAIITHVLATARHGTGARTRGLTFLALGSRQLAHALRLRPRHGAGQHIDRPLEAGVITAYALLGVAFALPLLRRVLRISPPRLAEAVLLIGLSLLSIGLPLRSGPGADESHA